MLMWWPVPQKSLDFIIRNVKQLNTTETLILLCKRMLGQSLNMRCNWISDIEY